MLCFIGSALRDVACYLLLVTCYLLLFSHLSICPLPTAHCPLPAGCCLLAGDPRLRKLRNTEIPVDAVLLNTVLSACSIIMMAPLDVPAHLPPLMEALLRLCSISSASVTASTTAVSLSTTATSLLSFNSLKDWIKRTILEFKRTHQDRYSDTNFKLLFTAQQWDELQGSGVAATYFS